MAVGTSDLRQIADVDRMLEVGGGAHNSAGRSSLGLGHEGVALVAVAAHHSTVSADVLTVMAAEAPAVIEVAEIIEMRLPVQLHLRECGVFEDLLDFADSVANFQLLRLGDIRILGLVKIL